MRPLWLLATALVVIADRSAAQVTYDGCVNFQGRPVASMLNNGIADVAIATTAPDGTPVILYSMAVLSWIQPPTRLFFYAHECAHHVRGHLTTFPSVAAERDADCWAIHELVDRGWINDADLSTIQADIAKFGRGDWSHISGPERAIELRQCLGGDDDDDDDAGAWQEVYDDCMDEAPGRCMDTCQETFGHPYARCLVACRPDDALNQQSWGARCKRQADQATKKAKIKSEN